ncbi:MAG: TonB-dependent receptor [Candidatus Sulfotelmatobacter sp.]
MLCLSRRVVGMSCLLLLLVSLAANSALAQLETATVSGQVLDPSGLSITGAQVKLVDIDRDTATGTATNSSGLYTFPSVRPGRYRMEVTAAGFKVVNVTGITVNVQDHLEQNFKLTVGSVSESVTVEGGAPLVDTESAAVSTAVDRQFAENLPLNGRSFQSLIELTPGVVLTAAVGTVDTGQFSINGQRANANYWMVDGVSANIGINAGSNAGSGAAGTLGSTSVFGGTNSLVSVDALQEFRIQTSTYAPEFGRTPGGQISIVTRSGANQFHGTAFDYFRNTVLDANDWFADQAGLTKPKEQQNDFGGTLSGPFIKDKTFFFFSYEGLRLRLPQTALTLVPDTNPQDPYSRQFAAAALLPYVNAFPLPNGPEVLDVNGNHQGVAQFNGTYSDPGTLDAYSLRVDHKLNDRFNIFGRYNYSPSKISQRGTGDSPLSTVSPTATTTQTATVGANWSISPVAANDFRFNYSSTDASSSSFLDAFGGAVPLQTVPFPSPFTAQNAYFNFDVLTLGNYTTLLAGVIGHNRQRQLNILDSVSLEKGSHGLKFGVDYRRLSPRVAPAAYAQLNYFADVASAETESGLYASEITSTPPVIFLFRNLGTFAQDTWHIARRLTLTYGLRWDVDFVPSSISGPDFSAVTGFDLSNLSNLALLPPGTPPYKTKWGNVAPRIGVAYQVSDNQHWQMVLRGGFGVFYDLGSSQAGSIAGSQAAYPFTGLTSVYGPAIGGTALFPLSSSNAAPPLIEPPNATNGGELTSFDPNLESPYTLQWNVAIEQALGTQQTLSVSYVGAAGRRLIETASIYSPNPNLGAALLVTNAGTSDYNALQLQFQRRLTRGLQALASYSWSHSIDTASSGSTGSSSNALSAINSNVNRGPSDFDIRNAFSAGLTYDLPTPKGNALTKAILRGWSTENIIQARSAPPVDVSYVDLNELSNGFLADPRPDVVAGQPFYLYGSQYPGGKAFNPAAFTPPPLDPVTGLPISQGNLPRNALRGFGAAQWDFAVHRDFPIHESLKLQFRAEMFNVLNHPNFGPPVGDLGIPGTLNSQFGLSMQMLGRSLAGGQLGNGGFDPLYQLGGPRSIQFGMKLVF